MISNKFNKREKPNERYTLIIKHLAKLALNKKWIEDQTKNTNYILSPCEFCNYVKNNEIECSECVIPEILCRDDGYKGLIGCIFEKFGNISLKRVGRDEYSLVRESLMDILKDGKLSLNTTHKIKTIINSNINT